MPLDLFAGNRVSDFAAAKAWYERFMGGEPAFMPHATEAVWELAEHRWLYILEDAGGPGRALNTILVDDLDARVAAIASRGLEPTDREEYDNGARKAIFHDPDGNEISFAGTPG
jgi:catechol 2,3-dioxygenase-like lactoylglutathione lyase family enzyme